MVNNIGIMINADVNVKNLLGKMYPIKDLFGILVYVVSDKGFIWNSSICDCECDKSCDVGQKLDYENFRCRKKLIDRLVEECSENIDGNEMIYNATLNVKEYASAAQYAYYY